MTHRFNPAGRRVRVTVAGERVADSLDAVALEEGAYPVVFYFPRKDVRMERLASSPHRTRCPWKGEARYYSLTNGPENIAWSYEQPLAAAQPIAGRLAFYASKVDAITIGDD